MDENKRSVEVSRGLAELRDFVLGFLAIPAGMIFMALQYRPDTPSLGYAPWLKRHGVQQPWADAMAGLLVRRAARIENDSRWMPGALKAIRALGRRGIRRADAARHVGLLLAAWEKSSAIETIFSEMGLDEFEFIHALKTAKSDDKPALDRVKEIARTIGPHIRGRRGPKISAPSAAHEFFLDEVTIGFIKEAIPGTRPRAGLAIRLRKRPGRNSALRRSIRGLHSAGQGKETIGANSALDAECRRIHFRYGDSSESVMTDHAIERQTCGPQDFGELERVPVGDLRPNPRNARTHPAKQLKGLAAIIAKVGFLNPILVDDQNIILAGHGRWEFPRHLAAQNVDAFTGFLDNESECVVGDGGGVDGYSGDIGLQIPRRLVLVRSEVIGREGELALTLPPRFDPG
jgi:hypothetical protein